MRLRFRDQPDHEVVRFIQEIADFRKTPKCREAFLAKHAFVYELEPFEDHEIVAIKKAWLKAGGNRNLRVRNHCFSNAQRLALKGEEPRIRYVEGLASSGVFPLEHGWISYNGKILDPTWWSFDWNALKRQSYFDELKRLKYAYVGVEFNNQRILERLKLNTSVYDEITLIFSDIRSQLVTNGSFSAESEFPGD